MKRWCARGARWLILLSSLATPGAMASVKKTPHIATGGSGDFRWKLVFSANQNGATSSTCTSNQCRELKKLIDEAESAIDFAIYGIRGQDDIIAALVRAQIRGVTVRGIVDTERVASTSHEVRLADCSPDGLVNIYEDTPRLVAELGGETFVKCDRESYTYIMHNKFFIFDGDRPEKTGTVWTGTTNVSSTCSGGENNANTSVIISSKALAAVYRSEFEEMWVNQPGQDHGLFHRAKTDNTEHVLRNMPKGTRVESYFSPTDSALTHGVYRLIDSAQKTLHIQMFFLTDATAAAKIVAAHRRGVDVRVIIDATGGNNRFSKTPMLCAAGVPVKTENWSYKQHNKVAVADSGVSGDGAAVLGSMNWTFAGDQKNDENTLYIKNDSFAEAIERDFGEKWQMLEHVPVCSYVPAEGNLSSTCRDGKCKSQCISGSCCDGIDNDYDDLTDDQDGQCTDTNNRLPPEADEVEFL